ncbi:GDP-mannose transporter GONST1 [Tetrabaena socialis]|uniref:GDP-mannose transporter GONST1 n=1 Tax=Tetrabaena socialis TaxID=47790 RepID=A0A2J8A5Q0_9CHLO|nr:GDP-mannose transporter GONST1 [Tetrabaena socialis]|eukprot:PNH07851.1 GDP-mannose transporter GONST1 [Tetrabaena socialis]
MWNASGVLQIRNSKLSPGPGTTAVEEADVEVPLLRDEDAPPVVAKVPARTIAGLPSAVVAGFSYCMASASMVLLNKHALASFGFSCPNSLLCFQCSMAVVMVKMCGWLGVVKLQPLKRDLVRVWFPVNLIFVAMLGTGFYALKEMGIGMFSVWKQLANLFTGEDEGAVWAMRGMDEFSMMYYNNLLSIPPIMGLMWAFGEFETIQHQPALANPAFQKVVVMSGFLGFAISFSSLWFLSQTTATIYSLIGSLNKIPIAIVGLLAFNEPTNLKNLSSIIIGLSAGVLFTRVKH